MLKPGSSRISIRLRNHSCRKVTINAKTIIAKVTAANVVPHSLAPNLENENMLGQYEACKKQLQDSENNTQSDSPKPEKPKLTTEKEKLLFSKIDFSGAKGWDPELLEETKQLFRVYAHIFALESLDMGHTSMVKHKIRLDNYMSCISKTACFSVNCASLSLQSGWNKETKRLEMVLSVRAH